jgi:Putative aminopeptidase
MRAIRATALGWLLLAGASGCAARTAPQVVAPPPPATLAQPSFAAVEAIGELKSFEEVLGGQQTQNFLQYSPRATADDRCYVTGKLQLPEFYSGLRLIREDESRCTARATEYDVFFYPVQAVASGEETITVSLAEAPLERMLAVVPHEDFHNQAEAMKAPTEVAESAATLVGLLTASAFAREKYGDTSAAFTRLDRDADLFLQKSLIVNLYYDKLSDVYKSFRSGLLTEAQTLNQKAELFAALQSSCSAISPDPVSFNKCPAAMNNAGLAFDRTYTRNFPIMFDLYTLVGRNTATFVPTLKRLLTNWPSSAARASDLLKTQ